MILEGFLTGLIGNILKEVITQAIADKRKRLDEREVEKIVAAYLAQHQIATQPSPIANGIYIVMVTSGLVGADGQIILSPTEAGEVPVQFRRGVIEEQLKRARRRKKEIQDFITEAEHKQGNLLQSSKRLLNAMSHLNGARDDEFTITEKNENASVGNPTLQLQLEQLRWQEKLHHEWTRDNITRPHTDPIKSATSMSDDQLLDHWKIILAAYRERLGVIETRIRGLETIRARLAAGKI